jgi:hypothetical protein
MCGGRSLQVVLVAVRPLGGELRILSLEEKQLTRTASTFSTRREVFLKKKVNVRTTDDFTKSVDARVNYMFPENEKMNAHLAMLFDRNNTADRP